MFEDASAALDRMVLAMVRRVGGQPHTEVILMGRDPNFPVDVWKERRVIAEGTMELTTTPESSMMLQS
jgi:hypothetical protein